MRLAALGLAGIALLLTFRGPAAASLTPWGSIPVGWSPGSLAVDARTGRAFVTNYFDDSVSVLDTRRGTVVGTVSVGRAPFVVAVDEHRGRAFVLDADDGAVSILSTTTATLVRTVQLTTVGALAVDERNGHAFIVEGDTGPGAVVMLAAGSGSVMRTTPVGATFHTIAIDARTRRVFVTNRSDGTLSVLDADSGRALRTVSVGVDPVGIAVDAQTDRVFVSNQVGNTVSVLDARSGAPLRAIAVGAAPQALAIDARTARVFVVDEGDGTVSVLDARGGRVLRTIAVGPHRPRPLVAGTVALDVAVDEQGGHVFVLNGARSGSAISSPNGSVSVLDARSGRIQRTVRVGAAPLAMAMDERTGHLFVVNSGPAGLRGAPRIGDWLPSNLRRWLPRSLVSAQARPSLDGSVSVLDTTRL